MIAFALRRINKIYAIYLSLNSLVTVETEVCKFLNCYSFGMRGNLFSSVIIYQAFANYIMRSIV